MFRIITTVLAFVSMTGMVLSQDTVGTVSGIFVDPNGVPISGARVGLTSERGVKHVVGKTVTDSSGRFEFKSVESGRYLLKLSDAVLEYEDQQDVRVSSGADTSVRFEYGSVCKQTSPVDPDFAKDRRAIVTDAIRLAIERLFSDKERKKGVVLSQRNIEGLRVTGLSGITVLDSQAIREKAERDGDFTYLSLSNIADHGSCMALTFNRRWAAGKDSTLGYVSGNEIIFEFRLKNGKWVSRIALFSVS